VHAVNEVSLTLRRGEVLGIAGESGSGKSTLAFAMTRLLHPPGVITAGQVRYFPRDGDPLDVLRLPADELRRFRWTELAIVFQSAMNALNPVLSLRSQLTDVLAAHRSDMSHAERTKRMDELLAMVGIPADRAAAFPHELSGGMRQRAMIAIALSLEPDIVVMDEPTTALDVVMQREILAEIMRLRRELGFSIVFITHDLPLLVEIADTIAVMYAGRVVEAAPAHELYTSPRHPYSFGLLNSSPRLHGTRRELTGISGSPPDLRDQPGGCPFHPRCAYAMPECTTTDPPLAPSPVDPDSERHQVACLLYSDPASAPPRLPVPQPARPGGDG
jgi:peptide/nickel transport system ATP-binding protein